MWWESSVEYRKISISYGYYEFADYPKAMENKIFTELKI
jgi:hypothetical protein